MHKPLKAEQCHYKSGSVEQPKGAIYSNALKHQIQRQWGFCTLNTNQELRGASRHPVVSWNWENW